MKLNEQVNAQIAALSERVKKLKTIIRRVDYLLAFSGVIALLTFLFPKTLSLKITSLDIPATLLLLESSGVSGRLGSVLAMGDTVESAALGMISTMAPIMAAIAFIFGAFNMIMGSSGAAIHGVIMGLAMIAAPSFVSGFLGDSHEASTEQRYVNDVVMRNIINFDDSDPISQEYINKVSRVDERYVLAQAAILSEADYPSSYFKSLAGDLSKESSFKPTEKALYSIEMAAYGHPESQAIVERANTLNGYEKMAGAVNSIAELLFVMLFLGGAGLKLLRMSINKRLKTILEMVSSSQDKSEIA